MRLNDPLPTSIFFNGTKYPLNLAFNNVLDVLEILNNKRILLMHKLPAIIEFLIGHNDLDTLQQAELEKDAKYIYASFRQIGINLFDEQNKMQWCEFQALMQALPDDCILQRIIRIRLWKPSKGESGEYKAQMRKLQEKYRLDGGDDDE